MRAAKFGFALTFRVELRSLIAFHFLFFKVWELILTI